MSEKDEKIIRLIEAYKKCDAYFKEVIDEAKKNQRIQISEEVAAYLMWLLIQALRKDPQLNPEPLIKRYLNIINEEGTEIFRDVGDLSLIIVGIWPESLTKKLIDPDYYVRIGSLAYKRESEANATLDGLFEELSMKFAQCADILNEATHLVPESDLTPINILKLYEKWLKTHNESYRKKLEKVGINPIDLKVRKQ